MTARMAALRTNPWGFRVLLVVLALAFISSLALRFGAASATADKGYRVPQSPRLESLTGIRVTQASLVGDGGLIEVRYTVLDTQKASRFQSNTQHPPVIYSERDRSAPVYRTALMRQGHDLRPGQSYFILYQNNHGVVHRGDTVEIDAGDGRLTSVPVR
jgi:hypothetical protein